MNRDSQGGDGETASRSALAALLRQRCAWCRVGPVFRGQFAMHERCPHCRHKFEREPGYFLGAMYFSYGIGAILMALLAFAAYWLLPPLALPWYAVAGAILFLPFVPVVFRYSRLLWMSFDHRWDP